MNNEDTQLENLENLTNEELEAKVEETNAEEDSQSTDWKSKAEQFEKRAAMLQRLLNKKDKTINKTNPADDISSDIAEIKFINKVNSFSEEHGLTKAQAERVLRLYPNANSETLKDPFISSGIKALERKERVEAATPGAGRVSSVNGKSFKEMSKEERSANFSAMMSQYGVR